MSNNKTPLEYRMSKKHFDAILKTRKAEDMKENPFDYAIRLVNREYGLLGTVRKILISDTNE